MSLHRYEHLSGSARDSARADAAKLYRNGATVRHIAAEMGRSYGFVHRLLIESGVPIRGRGTRTPTSAPVVEIPGQLALDEPA